MSTPAIAPDGLIAPEVGPWAESKYRHIELYDRLFSTGMKEKWQQRVYIDLYAGAGCSWIKSKGKFVNGSPLIALSVVDPFDKYIFCEEDPEKCEALRKRVFAIAPEAKVVFVQGNCD